MNWTSILVEKKLFYAAKTVFLFLSFLMFVFFISCIRSQNDDLGFVLLSEFHGGVYGFYENLRSNFEAPLGHLLFVFPLDVLSSKIGNFTPVVFVYLAWFFSLMLLIRGLAKLNGVSISRVDFVVFSFLTILTTIFSAWNRDTFQNAFFWVTGVYCNVLPFVIVNLALLAALFKKRYISFFFYAIVANSKINYDVIFILLHLVLLVFNKSLYIRNWRFWVYPITGFIFGFLVYVFAPGNLMRFESTNSLGVDLSFKNILTCFLTSLVNLKVHFQEPSYLIFFILGVVWCFMGSKCLDWIRSVSKFQLILMWVALGFILIFHSMFMILLLRGVGYGRIYAFSHYIFSSLLVFSTIWFVTYFNERDVNNLRRSRIMIPLILVTVIGLGVFVNQLKLDIYRARNFVIAYDDRIALFNQTRSNGNFHGCLILNTLPNAGLVGFHDIPTSINCNDVRVFNGRYMDIKPYDNVVFERYYQLPFKIKTVDRSTVLEKKFRSIRYQLTE